MLLMSGVLLVGTLGPVPAVVGAAPSAGAVESAASVVAPRSVADGALGSFSALGAGMAGNVFALALVDDTLYAGGAFSTASGVTGTRGIAAWSTADDTWHALGTGVSDPTYFYEFALAVVDDTVYAGGAFTSASGVSGTSRIAAWSTADDTWHALGTGVDSTVKALAVAADDTLYAGGSFNTASGLSADRVAAWSIDDDAWSALATGMTDQVYTLATAGDDTVYAGGFFGSASGVTGTDRIAAWSTADNAWHALGTGMSSYVTALATAGDDTLYAGGNFLTASGVTVNRVAAWSNADDTWHALGTGLDSVLSTLVVDDTRGLVYAGGYFNSISGGTFGQLNQVGVWDTGLSAWIPMTYASGNGLDNGVQAIAVDDSVVYLGGYFTNAGGVAAADKVARWTWDAPQGSNTVSTTVGASVTLTGEGFIGVPAVGGVKVGTTVATYTRDDSSTITMTVPAGSFTSAPITVNGVGGWGEVGALSVPAPPSPPGPTPTYPPGAPTSATAIAGDTSAAVSWTAPADPGSYPISTYQVTATPGSRSCMTSTLTCEVSGLTNGTTYTFTVKALNGAGWGDWSASSNAVTPQAAPKPSILISGSRAGSTIRVDGTTIDLTGTVTPWVKLPGQTSFTEGSARPTITDNAFTWSRKANKKAYVYITHGAVKSNTITIAAR